MESTRVLAQEKKSPLHESMTTNRRAGAGTRTDSAVIVERVIESRVAARPEYHSPCDDRTRYGAG